MIKAVIFDCFGVLTSDIWREYTITLPADVKEEVHGFNQARGAGQLSRKEFIANVAKAAGRSIDHIEKVSNPAGNSKNVLLMDYIRELRQKRYRIGLLSNVGSNWIRDSFLTPEEEELFDDILLSYEVNLTKPDPRIYHLAAERLGVSPNGCVLIDDIEPYCQAARKEGMQAIVYKNFIQMKQELSGLLNSND